MNVEVGHWAVFYDGGYKPFSCSAKLVEKVKPKTIKFVGTLYPRQVSIDSVITSFADEPTARGFTQAVNGVAGEFDRRTIAARKEYEERVGVARKAAERQIATLVSGKSA